MIDTSIIHGVRPSKLSADERAQQLIRRVWTRAERRVVLAGFFGRLSIAIEPFICGVMFAVITVGIFAAPHLSPKWVPKDIVIVAPVFGLGVLACIAWALGVMLAPARALLQTVRPIYVVDGYIRYRGRDEHSDANTNGYVAVLTDDASIACEWPTLGQIELPRAVLPALCEFSEYGGVHSIDGRPTGVLPARIPTFGVGIHGRKEEIV